MLELRKSRDRGHADHGWLESYHTFSFASYRDPNHVGFRDLRVINEDRVQPGKGFGTHPHSDMEIVSYVLEGQLAHKDSTGNVATLHRGDVQAMSAGSGLTHSEFNPSEDAPTHFFQIWLHPAHKGTEPAYADRSFPDEEKRNRLRLIVSPDGADGSLTIGQDARLYASLLESGARVGHALDEGRHAWVQLAGGAVSVNGVDMAAGDGLAVSDVHDLSITAGQDAELLLFDLR